MTGTSTTYQITVPGQQTAQDYRGVPFVVTYVEWRTYVYEGEAYQLVTCFGVEANGDAHNVTLSERNVPEWVPRPPQAWFVLAAKIASQAEGVA